MTVELPPAQEGIIKVWPSAALMWANTADAAYFADTFDPDRVREYRDQIRGGAWVPVPVDRVRFDKHYRVCSGLNPLLAVVEAGLPAALYTDVPRAAAPGPLAWRGPAGWNADARPAPSADRAEDGGPPDDETTRLGQQIRAALTDWEAADLIRPGWDVTWSVSEGCYMTSFRPAQAPHRGFRMNEIEMLSYAQGVADLAPHLAGPATQALFGR